MLMQFDFMVTYFDNEEKQYTFEKVDPTLIDWFNNNEPEYYEGTIGLIDGTEQKIEVRIWFLQDWVLDCYEICDPIIEAVISFIEDVFLPTDYRVKGVKFN